MGRCHTGALCRFISSFTPQKREVAQPEQVKKDQKSGEGQQSLRQQEAKNRKNKLYRNNIYIDQFYQWQSWDYTKSIIDPMTEKTNEHTHEQPHGPFRCWFSSPPATRPGRAQALHAPLRPVPLRSERPQTAPPAAVVRRSTGVGRRVGLSENSRSVSSSSL